MKLIYTAPNESAARVALDELAETWQARYPAMIRLWENAWAEFIPFLDYDIEIRTVICSTNAIESLISVGPAWARFSGEGVFRRGWVVTWGRVGAVGE